MQLVRVAMAAVVLGVAAVAPHLSGASLTTMAPLCAGYGVLTAGTELARRRLHVRALGTVGGMLLVDGAFTAVVLAASSGSRSVLVFLLYLHVVAVTLLVSYRTGLKIALWHVLLMVVTVYGQSVGLLAGGTTPVTDDIAVVNAIGLLLVALGAAWFSALNERELRRGKAELRVLADVSAGLEGTHDAAEIGRVLLQHVLRSFDELRTGAVVLDADLTDDAARRAWNQRDAVLLRHLDRASNPRLAAELPGAVNVVVVPLVADGESLGVLALERGGGLDTRIPGRTLAVMNELATRAALALRAAALRAEVERLATIDGLTGLANRRVFDQSLHRELARAARTGEPCTVVMLDVDHFKQVNDTHGHRVGDQVLRSAGTALAAACRESDLPARYGGEEFVVIVPGCDVRNATATADRLRTAMSSGDAPVSFTVSAGVATFPAHAADEVALLEAADAALYQSKHKGRDRVTVSRRRSNRPLVVRSA